MTSVFVCLHWFYRNIQSEEEKQWTKGKRRSPAHFLRATAAAGCRKRLTRFSIDLWYWSISLRVSLSRFTSLTNWARSWATRVTHTHKHTHLVGLLQCAIVGYVRTNLFARPWRIKVKWKVKFCAGVSKQSFVLFRKQTFLCKDREIKWWNLLRFCPNLSRKQIKNKWSNLSL